MSGRSTNSAARQIRSRGRIGHRLVFSFVLLATALVGSTGLGLYTLTRRSFEQQMGGHLVAVARMVAALPNLELLRRLKPGSEDFRFYRSMSARLQRAREQAGLRRIYIFDREGRNLLDTEKKTPIGGQHHDLRIRDRLELARVWEGEAIHSVLFPDGDTYYMTGYAPVYAGEQVVAAVGVDLGAGYMESIRAFKRSVLLYAGIGLLLTVVVALILAGRLTRPIQRLVLAARQIGQGNLGQAVDTSARDELGYLGETMEEMRVQLLARDAQLRQMLAGVAHEIRNPLGGIEIYASLIADDLPAEDPRRQHIHKVIEAVRVLDKVITEFLAFARPAPPSPQWAGVDQLVDDAAFLLAPEMKAARINYRQEVSSGLQVYADPEQVRRVVFNLLKNGVQAMQQGGRLWVRGHQEDGEVVVEVADTGPGMPPEVRERLFEPFFTTKQKGSGLGLAIIRQTLEENRGRIEVETALGRGTTFRVILPGNTNGTTRPQGA